MTENIKLRFFRNTGIPENPNQGDIVFNPQTKRISICTNANAKTFEEYGGEVQNAVFENSQLTITKKDGSFFILDFSDVASATDVETKVTKVVGKLNEKVENQGNAITVLQDTVGNASSGLVKDVNTLKTEVEAETTGLLDRVSALETSTGTGEGALGSRVQALETTVGDENSGLVKKVNDNSTAITSLQNNKADKATTLAGYGITDAYTKSEVDGKLSSAYKAQGSKTASALTSSLLIAANEGYVYNISDELEITDSNRSLFVENVKSSYPAGTNVVVVNVGGAYKFDVIAGFVDLTAYAKTADQKTITDALSGRIKTIEDSYVTTVKTTHTSSTSTKEGAHKDQLTVTPNVDTKGAVNITINETALDATLDAMATAISQAQSTAAAGVRSFGGEQGAITIDETTSTNWEAKFKMDGKKLTATINHDTKLDNYAAGGNASTPVYISDNGTPTVIAIESTEAANGGANLVTSGAAFKAITKAITNNNETLNTIH